MPGTSTSGTAGIAMPSQFCQMTEIPAVTMDQIEKRGRGRPPKHGQAMSGAERQSLYAKARQRDMAEVAHALKGCPGGHQGQPESLQ